jgi:nucleoside-diphosphate-sugar epimerase
LARHQIVVPAKAGTHIPESVIAAPRNGVPARTTVTGYALMRVFLAGAGGAIGRRLVPLLLRAEHEVTGTTRSAEKTKELERAGVVPAVVDVFDAPAVSAAMRAAKAQVVIHQLTDLPREFDDALIAASYAKNARIRTEGTRNLIATAQACGARRFIVQSDQRPIGC